MLTSTARSVARTIIAMASIGAIAFTAVAVAGSRLLGPPAAPTVAVVDLEEVLKSMSERVDREEQFKNQVKDMQTSLDKLRDDLKSEEEKLKMEPDSPAKIEMIKAFAIKRERANFERDLSQKILEQRKVDLLRELYQKIDKTVREMAQSQSWSLVLSSDERAQIPSTLNEADTIRAIAIKRIMYVDKPLDITDDVVKKLNLDWAANGGKGGGPATPPPAKSGVSGK